MTEEEKKNAVCSPPHQPLSHFTSQIQNVLLDGVGELSLTSVDMLYCLNPDIREGQRQIDNIAFLDVPRVEKGSQDREECPGILQICAGGKKKPLLAPFACGDAQSEEAGTYGSALYLCPGHGTYRNLNRVWGSLPPMSAAGSQEGGSGWLARSKTAGLLPTREFSPESSL